MDGFAQETDGGTGHREIIIKGTPAACMLACQMINETIAGLTGDYQTNYVTPSYDYQAFWQQLGIDVSGQGTCCSCCSCCCRRPLRVLGGFAWTLSHPFPFLDVFLRQGTAEQQRAMVLLPATGAPQRATEPLPATGAAMGAAMDSLQQAWPLRTLTLLTAAMPTTCSNTYAPCAGPSPSPVRSALGGVGVDVAASLVSTGCLPPAFLAGRLLRSGRIGLPTRRRPFARTMNTGERKGSWTRAGFRREGTGRPKTMTCLVLRGQAKGKNCWRSPRRN